jgi:hypothetical protein
MQLIFACGLDNGKSKLAMSGNSWQCLAMSGNAGKKLSAPLPACQTQAGERRGEAVGCQARFMDEIRRQKRFMEPSFPCQSWPGFQKFLDKRAGSKGGVIYWSKT